MNKIFNNISNEQQEKNNFLNFLVCSFFWIFENYSILSKFSTTKESLIQSLKIYLREKLLKIEVYLQSLILSENVFITNLRYREIFSKILNEIRNNNSFLITQV